MRSDAKSKTPRPKPAKGAEEYVLEVLDEMDGIIMPGIQVRISRFDPEKMIVIIPPNQETADQIFADGVRLLHHASDDESTKILILPPGAHAFRIKAA